MSITAISQAPVFVDKTQGIASSASSFSTTHSLGAPSADFLDNMMSAVVGMDNAEHTRRQEVLQLNPFDSEDNLRHSALNLESTASISAFKKGVSSLETLFQKIVISPT